METAIVLRYVPEGARPGEPAVLVNLGERGAFRLSGGNPSHELDVLCRAEGKPDFWHRMGYIRSPAASWPMLVKTAFELVDAAQGVLGKKGMQEHVRGFPSLEAASHRIAMLLAWVSRGDWQPFAMYRADVNRAPVPVERARGKAQCVQCNSAWFIEWEPGPLFGGWYHDICDTCALSGLPELTAEHLAAFAAGAMLLETMRPGRVIAGEPATEVG